MRVAPRDPPIGDGGLRVHLEARNPARNVFRFYRLETGRDLFGTLVLTLTSGRIGSGGRWRILLAGDEMAIRKEFDRRLRRRATAPRRLGCVYLPVSGEGA